MGIGKFVGDRTRNSKRHDPRDVRSLPLDPRDRSGWDRLEKGNPWEGRSTNMDAGISPGWSQE